MEATKESVRNQRTHYPLVTAFLLCTVALLQAQSYESASFPLATRGDGIYPVGTLIQDGQGNLYGTTSDGSPEGTVVGSVFEVTRKRAAKILHTFLFNTADGIRPMAGLVMDTAGNLYGTTMVGGTGSLGEGTVFKLDPEGTETVLYTFQGQPDGEWPEAPVILDSAGNLYGTTTAGGTFGIGTVFKLDSAGNETILHSFQGTPDGEQPQGPLILDQAGNLYGTTASGGAYGYGTVFKLDTLAGCGKTRFEAGAVPRTSLVSTAQPDKKEVCVDKTSSSWMCSAT